VALSVVREPLPEPVRAIAELMFSKASLPQGDQVKTDSSACWV
jgi:hypothetical protein